MLTYLQSKTLFVSFGQGIKMNAIQCCNLIQVKEGYMEVNIIRPKFPIKSKHNNQISCSMYDSSIRHGICTLYSIPSIAQ